MSALSGSLKIISILISSSVFSKKDKESSKLKKTTFLSKSYKPLLKTASILKEDCFGIAPKGVETEEDDIILILSPTTTPNSIARCFPIIVDEPIKSDNFPSIIFSIYVEEIRQFLSFAFNLQIFPEDVYFLNEMPSEISISSILTISAFSIFITILASLFPSLAVVKIEPIKALKYE